HQALGRRLWRPGISPGGAELRSLCRRLDQDPPAAGAAIPDVRRTGPGEQRRPHPDRHAEQHVRTDDARGLEQIEGRGAEDSAARQQSVARGGAATRRDGQANVIKSVAASRQTALFGAPLAKKSFGILPRLDPVPAESVMATPIDRIISNESGWPHRT